MNIEGVELVFRSDDSFFSIVGEVVSIDSIDKSLNLGIGILYKKSLMADIVSFLINKYHLNEDKQVKTISKALAFIILGILAPKTTQWKFSDENEYSQIKSLLKMERGMQYFNKADILHNSTFRSIIDMLLIEDFIVEQNDRYYIKGYYLESLTISKPVAH